MGALVEFARRVLNRQGERSTTVPVLETTGPILAVKIGGSVIGDFWLCLSDTEPLDPGDGLPIYRPSEIKALAGKGYGPEALEVVNWAKLMLDGEVS